MSDAELSYLQPTVAPTTAQDPSAPTVAHTDAETTGRLDTDGNPILRQRVTAYPTAVAADPNNTTTTPLTAGGTFTGTATDISAYAQVNVELYARPSQIAGDGSTARGSLFLEFSPDAAHWDISIPVLVRDPGLLIPIPLINAGRFYRARYLNDGGALAVTTLGLPASLATTPAAHTQLRLTSQLLPAATKELGRTLDQSVSGSDPVSLTRAAIMGQAGDLSLQNIDAKQRTDGTFALKVDADIGERTVFGSLFAEQLTDDISINFSLAIPASLATVTTANGGSVTQAQAQASLQSSAAATGQALLVSQHQTAYQPGHEIRCDFTATFTQGVAGAVQYMGLYDASNGFYLGYNGTGFVVAKRSAGVDTQVAQASWNGNLATTFTRDGIAEAIDFTKGNVYRIRFGWLGNAVINFEVLSPDGNYCLIHQIKFPNTSTTASIQNPNLPMRAEVTKTTGASNVTVKTSSWRAGSFGRVDALSIVNSPATSVLAGGGVYTSDWYSCLGWASISLLIDTDQISAALTGVDVQFSDDGINVRNHKALPLLASHVSSGSFFELLAPAAEFFRLVYTNGANVQGRFFVNLTLARVALQQNSPTVAVPALGALGGQAGVSGTVVVPAGAIVTGIAAQSGNVAASATIPGITGAVTIPGSNQAQTQFNMSPPAGTMVGPCSITFSSTAAYVVEWVL